MCGSEAAEGVDSVGVGRRGGLWLDLDLRGGGLLVLVVGLLLWLLLLIFDVCLLMWWEWPLVLLAWAGRGSRGDGRRGGCLEVAAGGADDSLGDGMWLLLDDGDLVVLWLWLVLLLLGGLVLLRYLE